YLKSHPEIPPGLFQGFGFVVSPSCRRNRHLPANLVPYQKYFEGADPKRVPIHFAERYSQHFFARQSEQLLRRSTDVVRKISMMLKPQQQLILVSYLMLYPPTYSSDTIAPSATRTTRLPRFAFSSER